MADYVSVFTNEYFKCERTLVVHHEYAIKLFIMLSSYYHEYLTLGEQKVKTIILLIIHDE